MKTVGAKNDFSIVLGYVFFMAALSGCGVEFPVPKAQPGNRNEATAQSTLQIEWDPNPESDVAYRIYYGIQSRDYDQVLDAGRSTEMEIHDLAPRVYYFTATAYLAKGGESKFSNELAVNMAVPVSLVVGGIPTANLDSVGFASIGETVPEFGGLPPSSLLRTVPQRVDPASGDLELSPPKFSFVRSLP